MTGTRVNAPGWLHAVTVVLLCWAWTSPAQADRRTGIKYFTIAVDMHEKASALPEGAERAGMMAQVAQILRVVAAEHSDSPAGLALARQSAYRGLDMKAIDAELAAWKSRNPGWKEAALDVALLGRSAVAKAQESQPPATAAPATRPPVAAKPPVPAPPKVVQPAPLPVAPPVMAVAPPPAPVLQPPPQTMALLPTVPPQLAHRAPTGMSIEERIERLTVLVDTAEAVGTGFFVADNLIMTNAHVVSRVDQKKRQAEVVTEVKVVNEHVGIRRGKVVYVASLPIIRKNSKGQFIVDEDNQYLSTNPGLDMALIQLVDYRAADHLSFTEAIQRGSDISMTGYPSAVMDNDMNYIKYSRGEAVAPSVAFAQGEIMAIMNSADNGYELIQHSTRGAGGNSGSPLVNDCGQVVGIHFKGEEHRGDRFAFGYSARAIIRDLTFKGYNVISVDPTPCP